MWNWWWCFFFVFVFIIFSPNRVQLQVAQSQYHGRDSIYEYYSGRAVVVGLPTGLFLSFSLWLFFIFQKNFLFNFFAVSCRRLVPSCFSFSMWQTITQQTRTDGERAHLGFSCLKRREFHFRKQQSPPYWNPKQNKTKTSF